MKKPLIHNIWHGLKTLFVGRARDLGDEKIFQKISLIAFFAWIGLGADGLSSTCYGPEESFLVLGAHLHLGILVALATALTIIVISSSYMHIIEAFPSGGGGYLVASQLLSPTVGMVSGCALLVDYVLTISLSIASGTDAIFSFLPFEYQGYKALVATGGVCLLMLMNLRGVKESVLPLIPIFMLFVCTHVFVILYAIFTHIPIAHEVSGVAVGSLKSTHSTLGLVGMLLLALRAYSMSAGTYTGIEAVSNAIPMLREPRVETARKTMRYMAISLAVMAVGIMMAYILYKVESQVGKTMNAVMLETLSAGWHSTNARIFIMITLFSEAAILFIAAQTGFMGGPRVLANMALDKWVPTSFAMLSDRLVTHNGIILMGGAAIVLILTTGSSVRFLIVMYSMNVFITFALSQLGMVRYWWQRKKRDAKWKRKLFVNAFALLLSLFILFSVTFFKFLKGGWITLVVTGSLAFIAFHIKRYYNRTSKMLKRLDSLVEAVELEKNKETKLPPIDHKARTAVVMVNGFNGLGLHTLFAIIRMFGGSFRNFIFVHVGIVDAGNFKGKEEMENMEDHIKQQLNRYTRYVNGLGFHAEGFLAIGTDVIDEVETLALKIGKSYPNMVFFGGQLAFKEETILNRLLHNQIVFATQRRLYHLGLPFVILPIRV